MSNKSQEYGPNEYKKTSQSLIVSSLIKALLVTTALYSVQVVFRLKDDPIMTILSDTALLFLGGLVVVWIVMYAFLKRKASINP